MYNMKIVRTKVEYLSNPIGLDEEKPVFSWNVETGGKNWKQTAYQILVSCDQAKLSNGIGDIWNSGRVVSDAMVNVEYCGKKLEPATKYYWTVRVWNGESGVQSEVNYFETGFLEESCWKGKWLGEVENEVHHMYRRAFCLDKQVKQARAYICGLGQYELSINGKKVSDAVLQPGWTNYEKSCLYNVYDVTSMLVDGGNAIGVLLGDGMFHIPGHKGRYAYFPRSYGFSKFLFQLEIAYADGTKENICSNEEFHMAKSPVRYSCIYGGEEYMASDRQEGFDTYDFSEDDTWEPAACVEAPKGKLRAQKHLPLKVMETLEPVSVQEVKPGFFVYDFGKNFSGWVRIKVKTDGTAKDKRIKMKPGEILKEDGTPDQKVTGKNYSWDYYMDEKEAQEYAPKFTYTGFRYVQVEGAVPAQLAGEQNEMPVIESFVGEFIYPDMEPMGEFSCSNTLYNQIHGMITQAVLSNMKSILTDCPHREKLGWMEQSHLIGPAIMYNYDVHNLYEKIEKDMEEAQHEGGLVPDICPEYITEFTKWHYGYLDSPEWGSACIINPWYVYKKYGDASLFKRQYETMKRYLDYLTSKTHHHVLHHGLGDWLDIGPFVPYSQNTPVPVIATCIYYYDLSIMKQVAEILGKTEDAANYGTLMEQVKEEYNLQFFDDQGNRYATGSQAAQAMSLMVGLVPEEREEKVLQVLVKDIELRGYATTAGDVGHPFVTAALTKYNRSDIMNEMMKITDKPGYGYQVKCGATTLTEEWDGPDPKRPHGSQNHFMLGSGDEWFYSGLAGIQGMRCDVNFTEQVICPYIADNVEEVCAWTMHPYGKTKVHWKKEKDKVNIAVTLPPNTTGTFISPKGDKTQLGSGTYEFVCAY